MKKKLQSLEGTSGEVRSYLMKSMRWESSEFLAGFIIQINENWISLNSIKRIK